MSSFFKKRSSADAKSSSKSSHVTESDAKTQRNASSTSSSKSNAGHGPPSTNTGGGVAPNSKGTLSQPRDRKSSVDMQAWLETECPVDSRIVAATMQNNTLSISRSGRFKAKGKLRARLFSEDADGVGSPDDHSSNQAPRGSTSLSTPEDRQTVLDAMSKRPVAAAAPVKSPTAIKQGLAGGNPPSNTESGPNRKSSDRGSSSKWSTTSNSMDL